MRVRLTVLYFIIFVLFINTAPAQSPNGTVSGIVLDPSGGIIAGADVLIINGATGVQYAGKANSEGFYVVPNIPPGAYRIQVSNSGFKTIIKPDIIIHVLDAIAINFTLPIGAASEIVTVTGGVPLVNTENAAVSTVVDRQFAENLPLNGRSFQTLIDLTPGVVVTASNEYDGGQFSVNGQRPSSNYWMVDGVSANVGISSTNIPGNGFGGALGSFSALGGTNSLVSVDAMQEFRIQTSTYAPEFGRAPGGQISIVTRSGTSQFHGTAFEYLRNDVFDANDWFANATDQRKPAERQNDFGGTFSGPIRKDRTFFFFSYEGLRLRLPRVTLTNVPDIAARQNALPALQPYLNAFPLPNGPDNAATGVAQDNASYSNAASLDAYSLRVDHRLGSKWNLFARYNYSPSQLLQRGNGLALSVIVPSRIVTQTGTAGATWAISVETANDLRVNYSRTSASSKSSLDDFGGAVPLTSLPFPSPYTGQNATFNLIVALLGNGGDLTQGKGAHNLQRQINILDNVTAQKGSHSLKLGVDYRRLSPEYDPAHYAQTVVFLGVPALESGNPFENVIQSGGGATFLFHNLGMFAQDTWRVIPSLTLTYGLRWDVDFAPSTTNGATLPAVTGFNLSNLSSLALAPAGTPAFRTPYGNVAPRIGMAYQLSQNQNWQTVLRGGFGVFFDLATQETGNILGQSAYPFGATQVNFPSGTFPLDPSMAAPPAITKPGAGSGELTAFDPDLKLPYTLEWNVALEQSLGSKQSVSASYVGSVGRRLIQSAVISSPNSNLGSAYLVTNSGTSDYDALQLQFQRHLSDGLQALASFTWSHSIDDGSAGSIGSLSNTFVPGVNRNENRGPSDFDVRKAFSAGVTYEFPVIRSKRLMNALAHGWSLQTIIQARSAIPVTAYDLLVGFDQLFKANTLVRPDVIPGIPLYLYGSQYPGGKALNNTPGAVTGGCSNGSQSVGPFCPPPTDASGNPLRQGNLGRNALRGFGATQWDFAVHRDFPIREALKLQFRAEMFNVLNHPNFGQPTADISSAQFGRSTQMLGQYLNGGAFGGTPGSGAFDPLYQIGGPRSIQFALKLMF